METPTPPRFLDTIAAAAFLGGVSPSWLEVLRVRGGGPEYLKLGKRVVYKPEDLEAWAESNRRTSTAQLPKAG